MSPARANRLAGEKSPYLLEHSMNPVDWYPWGEEAFAKARNDNKPIFLSVGYSTCHWCHVLAKESFEDAKTASFINKNFIPVKVDREERPEVDAYYMGAVQAMTGGGGWPLSVFLTPDLKAFYGGTYFPPQARYGMPSFMQVLEFVTKLWKDRRDEVTANTMQVQRALKELAGEGPGEVKRDVLDEGYADLVSGFDSVNGGFGSAPKFPLPNTLGFLLRYHFRTGNGLALSAVLKTLDHMMAGGMRDHVGGGFHRYSTDRVWLVPHFEKMLYDNALLAKVYTEAYQITRREEYAEVVRETLDWISREMEGPEGGFYSAQDADTMEGEGRYYTWTPAEVEEVLGAEGGARFSGAYGVTTTGNFETRSLLHLDPDAKVTEVERKDRFRWKRELYRARVKRPRPATDGKILTSWNGLAISAFAFAGAVLEGPELVKRARRATSFVLENLAREGRLLRRYAGGEAALPGTLEDYAFFIQGLLDLFEADPDPSLLGRAVELADVMTVELGDCENGGFFLAADPVPARLKESYDGPTPSGNTVAALALLKLSDLTGNGRYLERAEGTVRAFGKDIEKRPSAHTAMLGALDLLLNGTREVVITSPTAEAMAPMRDVVFRSFLPDRVVLAATMETYPELMKRSSLLDGRKPLARPMAYVCRNFACSLPVDTPEGLVSQLAAR